MTEKIDHGASPAPVLPSVRRDMRPWMPEKEEKLRRAIVSEAMSWIGTPYVQQGDIKGAGVDCSMLLVRCWVDARIVDRFDPRPYPPNWHMHHSTERYLDWMEHVGVEVDTPKPGDVAIFMFGRCFSHGGVVVDNQQLVSASAGHKKVIRSGLNDAWLYYHAGKPRPRKYFDVFAKLRQSVI